MDDVILLNQMKDIYQPEAVSIWPLAPIWWLVLCMLIILLGWLVSKWIASRRLRWQSLSALSVIERQFQTDSDHHHLASSLSILVRQVAVAKTGAPRAAAVTGEDWLVLLDKLSSGKHFTEGSGRLLLSAPYDPQVVYDGKGLIQLVRGWIMGVT